MKAGVLVVILALIAGAALADCSPGVASPTSIAPQSLTGTQPISVQCPTIAGQNVTAVTVDNNFVYVLTPNEVLKLRKDNLDVVARTPLGAPTRAGYGRGPEGKGTPLYPSGSDIDYYAPTGSPVAPVFRAYDYLIGSY